MTIQLAHMRVLAFIRGSSPAALEIDYMEYATDGAAQSAYVTSATAYTSQYPTAQSDTYVKATTKYTTQTWPYFATDPALSVTGNWPDNSWVADVHTVTNQRFHIDLGSSKIINRVYYENFQALGINTYYGINNFTLWGSDNAAAFAELTYATDTNWTQITGLSQSTMDEHSAADAADPKYITIAANSTAYRYYAFKFADNHGSADFMGLRRIELQTAALNSFSESTIKTEGSYALKLSATTDALNETVTKTLTGGDILDLTGKNTIKLDARSTGTGSNLEMSIRDSGNENSGNLFIEAETDITDKNGTHTITAVGDAALSKAQISSYNNSSASVIFDGTGDYLSVPTHADFDFGTGDWTVDFSFYTNTVTSANDGLFTLEAGTENILSVWVGNNVIFCKVNSSQQTITVSASTWYHLAIERYGNTVTAYLDGVAEQTWDVTGISFDDNSAGIEIGGYATVGTYTLDGYMDNFRIVKGTSIFQSAFTPSNTTLLYPEYQTHTIDIVAADTYQAEVVDISDIADADKDDIDLIQFKVLNEDSARTFYIDNIRASADEYAYLTATGGTITYDGDYKIHTFTSDGTFTVKSLGSTEDEVEYLVVGGGGGGGFARGGGGGAGGYRTATGFAVTVQGYSITIGAGGLGVASDDGTDGGDSIFSTITSDGGGGGGRTDPSPQTGHNGGSGGGGGSHGSAGSWIDGGTGVAGQGYAGGRGGNIGALDRGAGGGGGASEVGDDFSTLQSGDGGDGTSSSISGASVTYAGGGGGGGYIGWTMLAGTGGAGGGGDGGYGDPGENGTASTGSGGGGDQDSGPGGNGGSGIVIIKYQYK